MIKILGKTTASLVKLIPGEDLLSELITFVSYKQILHTVPGREERHPDKEAERSPHVCYEGDGGKGLHFPFHPDFCGGKAVDESEVTKRRERFDI